MSIITLYMRFRVTTSCLFQRTDKKAGSPPHTHVWFQIRGFLCSPVPEQEGAGSFLPNSHHHQLNTTAHMRGASGFLPTRPCLTANTHREKVQDRHAPITGLLNEEP